MLVLASAASILLAALMAGAPLELQLGGGEAQLLRVEAEAHGLPIRGAYEVVALAGDGSRRSLTRREVEPPRVRPQDATVDRAQARAIATQVLGAAPTDATLVYVNVLGEAVLAWELSSPLRRDTDTGPLRERVWIGATTGVPILRRPIAFDSGAQVFEEDPASTPVPIEITFETIDVDTAGVPLSSPTIDVRGCVDASDQPAPTWWREGMCFPQARALSDAGGDFYVPLPNVGLAADNESFEDAYAEVAAYWYVERFFAAMAARGLTSHRCEQFTIVVNRYSLTLDREGEVERVPAGGANFVDECDPDVSPTLIVGQGRYVDYAYDADVLWHELGHSVIQHVSPDGLTDRRFTPLGILSEAGALNEGLADYLAMTIAGDPEVGEYIGRFSVDQTTPYLRTGQNNQVCPDDLVGQWHNDGLIVSGALWSARVRVGEVVDRVLLDTLARLEPDAVLDEFGRTFIDVAAEHVEAGTLDAADHELLARTFAGRGLLDCEHVITDEGLATLGKRMTLIADDEAITPFAPGPLQLRYVVPDGESELTVFFSGSFGGLDPLLEPAMTVLLRVGEPVMFEYASDGGIVEVGGSWDLAVEAESLNGQDFIARLPVEAGDEIFVTLANRSPVGASVSNFFVVASDVIVDEPEPDPDEGGCGCTSDAGQGGAMFAGVVLAWAALFRRGGRRGRRRGARA